MASWIYLTATFLMKKVIYIVLFCIAFIAFTTVSSAATINLIQSGTTSVGSGTTVQTQSITAVDLSASILVFSVRTDNNRPGRCQYAGYLNATDEITFERNESGTASVIEWTVYEFSSGVNVQRGTVTNLGAGGSNVTISSVDLSESFAILTMEKDGGQIGSDDGVTGNLTTSTNLFIDREAGGADPQLVAWQVVEWTGSNVEKIVSTLSDGDDLSTVTLSSSVDRSKSMVVGNHRISANIDADNLPGTELIDGNTVQFSRTGTTGDMSFVVYVVEFTDNTDVIHGQVRMLSTEDDITISICDVFSTSTAGMWPSSNMNRSGNNCMSTDDHYGYFWPTYKMNSSSSVRVQRTSNGVAALFPFQVLEFTAATPTSCNDPEPGASTSRTADLCLVTLPIELVDFNVSCVENGRIALEWATLSELNNDYFEIQRSTDGMNYEKIGIVDGAGNSSSYLEYLEFDHQAKAGINYYRLRQVDFDGASSYSSSKSVLAYCEESIQVYPNPAENGLVNVVGPISLQMEMYTSHGKRVPLQIKSTSWGFTLDVSEHAAGTYFLRMYNGSFFRAEKICLE